jgi:CHAT domain-containing protein/cytochrome c-type biogenesis protein CcmH/NrfG
LDENLQGHLGTAELARLLEQSRFREDLATPTADLDPHLAVCMSCREQLQELVLFDRKLKSANRPVAPAPQPDCPVPATWREVAGGLTPPLQTLGYIEHASRCNSCGPLLRQAIVDLNGLSQGLSEAEKKYIATLESSNLEWRQRLACQITGTLPSDRKSTMGWRWLGAPRLAIAGVSLLGIIIAASWVLVRRNQPPNAERLLARAYTETRTLELRMAGANYAPLRISRGPQASFASRSPALLKAEALIATQLQSHPSDPAWLQAKAQADLLEGKYDAAVEALRRALELEPHSPSVLTDLATAYFQRAQQEDKKDDFGAAYELLSQALRLRPDDPVALFNRAIVAEHQFLYQQALDDWDHYLRVDPASRWEEEARNHANSVREIIKQHGSKATPLLSPAAVIVASAGTGGEIDERVEEYLHEAVVSWLPQAFPEAHAMANSDAPKALFFLAELSQQGHGDRWLTDLLRESSAPHFPQAVTALARAVKANDAGEYDVSRQQSDLAEKLFRASGNTAGALRAQFEHTFADQIDRRSEECRRKATSALTEAENYSYPWLQIQLGLEKSVCSFLMGDIGAGEKANTRSELLTQQSGYGGLYLRAVLFAAEDRLATGDQAGGGTTISTGLERYWKGKFPDLRGYNLYTGLADIAEAAVRPNFELAIWREAVALIDPDEDLLLRAMAHNWMANAAMAAHLPEVAEQQYAQAARLFAAAPRTEANRNNGLQAEIRTAQLEAQQGRSDDAIARLTGIQDEVRPLSNNYLIQMFYSTLGELQLGRHREVEAEQALRPALALAEQNLQSLASTERTSWSKDASPAYLALVEAQLVQGRSQDALETYEWYLGAPQRVSGDARHHQVFTNPQMPIPSGLASRLPILTKETVLAYAILPDGLAVWAYDDRGINTRWIPKSTDGLHELAERFRDLSSDPSSELSALRRDARSLYGSLITPVEQHLAPERTLVIEADGWMARIPFEALLDSNGHYLIERASMVHSLGQDSEARLRSDAGISPDMPAFVLGSTASSAADGLIPLPDVAEEADTVARSFHSPRVFKGGEATLDAVRRELPEASVFHFAGHSLAAPQGTGLLLESGDRKTNTRRLMDANVVRQLRLQNLQLAVLSACGTASGGTGSNGFDSVTDALLRAGAPHVVASRWAVDSAETRGFVEDFYRNALSGHTVSEAIRLTSRNMLANPRTSHPYYWSAFAAYGRP